MEKVKMKLAGVPDEQVAKLLKYLEENESILRPFFDECQKLIVKKAIEKHNEELEEPGSTSNPYDNGYLNRQLLQTLNKQVYQDGLIGEEIYRKASSAIEKKKEYDTELMHILNKRMLEKDLISNEVFSKVEVRIDKLQSIPERN